MNTTAGGPRLIRPSHRLIAGVCAGLAEHLNLSVRLVRGLFVALAFAAGAGILLYAWLWVMTPSEAENTVENTAGTRRGADRVPGAGPQPVTGRQGRPGPGHGPAKSILSLGRREFLLGTGLLVVAAALIAQQLGAGIRWGTIVPIVVILVGAVLTWMQLDDTHRAGLVHRAKADQTGGFIRLGAGLALVIIGVLIIVSGAGSWALMGNSVLASLAVLAGVGLVLAPWGLKFWRDLEMERSGRAREAARAEFAAHLHDSVLQTLALIQNRAGSEQDVLRLARSQERELREWLYRDPSRNPGNLAARIKAIAADIEDAYGQVIDVVVVGDTEMSERHEALVQAAREALLNAARHAGGPVSVYLEATGQGCDIFVRDRGAGFDLRMVPQDRMGVRESIVGRMKRYGGTAGINSGPDGTEVRLSLPAASEGGSPGGARPAEGGPAENSAAENSAAEKRATHDI